MKNLNQHTWVCNTDDPACQSGCAHPVEHDAYCPKCGLNRDGTRYHYDPVGLTLRLPFRVDADHTECRP